MIPPKRTVRRSTTELGEASPLSGVALRGAILEGGAGTGLGCRGGSEDTGLCLEGAGFACRSAAGSSAGAAFSLTPSGYASHRRSTPALGLSAANAGPVPTRTSKLVASTSKLKPESGPLAFLAESSISPHPAVAAQLLKISRIFV